MKLRTFCPTIHPIPMNRPHKNHSIAFCILCSSSAYGLITFVFTVPDLSSLSLSSLRRHTLSLKGISYLLIACWHKYYFLLALVLSSVKSFIACCPSNIVSTKSPLWSRSSISSSKVETLSGTLGSIRFDIGLLYRYIIILSIK